MSVNRGRGRAGRSAGMAIDQYLKDGEWWDPNAPKPAEAAPAAK